MLPPEQFAQYLAVGSKKRARGPAMFFDLNEDFMNEDFDLSKIPEQCVAHENGEPKHSLYISVYRVMERVPLEALKSLWLATSDGRVLQLTQGTIPEMSNDACHLYKELCPVHPLVASRLNPQQFCKSITYPENAIYVPRICFVDLELGELATDPQGGDASNLPYAHMEHLRDCLNDVADTEEKETKTVDRAHGQWIPYRCVKRGFFVGDQTNLIHYPFPSHSDLENKHYAWWRSATNQ
jgi:hypothetical protein